ncbi:MAG: hypothetical protein IT291_01720 [Deltaproteobacteria bacterium]|nr:hypothetical protein [Deltaproteobacteria bacterium]
MNKHNLIRATLFTTHLAITILLFSSKAATADEFDWAIDELVEYKRAQLAYPPAAEEQPTKTDKNSPQHATPQTDKTTKNAPRQLPKTREIITNRGKQAGDTD